MQKTSTEAIVDEPPLRREPSIKNAPLALLIFKQTR
jgi:hypothetical protein